MGLYPDTRCICNIRVHSPHARGAVPERPGTSALRRRFSPRPWGCTELRGRPPYHHVILPTPVGLYLDHGRQSSRCSDSPHARGAVPCSASSMRASSSFSPRPWGCTESSRSRDEVIQILPTPVGLYPIKIIANRRLAHSPHARGAVPNAAVRLYSVGRFSPRPWGCTLRAVRGVPRTSILPTPVGLYLLAPLLRDCWFNSPHARGAVP